MSKVLRQVAACSPSHQTGTYIYTITPTIGGGLAAITSADELLVLDRQTLESTRSSFSDVPAGVTCLKSTDAADSSVICAGRDGVVATFDLRSEKPVSQFRIDRAVTALACTDNNVAVGTELAQQHSTVSLWDRRQNKTLWMNAENNDDITDLRFHPSRSNHLLSGGVDGLVSIFDTQIAEEDDSLLQVVNHGPIHKAGFLSNSEIYALSHDENFSIHHVTAGVDDDSEDISAPTVFGDLRPLVPCEYVVDIFPIGDTFYVATGTHSSNPHLSLVSIKKQSRLKYKDKVTVLGAHGDEIVRSIYADSGSGTLFTAGEDGQIRAFQETVSTESADPKSPRIRKTSDARFRPY